MYRAICVCIGNSCKIIMRFEIFYRFILNLSSPMDYAKVMRKNKAKTTELFIVVYGKKQYFLFIYLDKLVVCLWMLLVKI